MVKRKRGREGRMGTAVSLQERCQNFVQKGRKC